MRCATYNYFTLNIILGKMGNSNSPGLPDELLDEYALLTYLSKHEIKSLFKQFYLLGKAEMDYDFHYRFPCEIIEELFPNLKLNPFKDRIYEVFSSQKDNCFSFEDTLDMCSVFSSNCTETVKANWAFKIFDFDNDNEITENDIITTIDRLISPRHKNISETDKKYIATTLLETMDIQKLGGINALEFVHSVGKLSEFAQTFTFSI